nr:uncharacterized protein LOC105493224 [Macaca nemestrina]
MVDCRTGGEVVFQVISGDDEGGRAPRGFLALRSQLTAARGPASRALSLAFTDFTRGTRPLQLPSQQGRDVPRTICVVPRARDVRGAEPTSVWVPALVPEILPAGPGSWVHPPALPMSHRRSKGVQGLANARHGRIFFFPLFPARGVAGKRFPASVIQERQSRCAARRGLSRSSASLTELAAAGLGRRRTGAATRPGQWLPSGNDGWGSARHAPPEASTVAHRKRDRVGSGVLDHRARPGPVCHNQEPESEDVELPLEGYVPAGLELAALWPGSPPPKERECYNHSPDGDSSSDYVNNISAEEDYDEGLPEEEEGITYYIYCPEDDSYLEGIDCNGEEYLAHGAHPMDTDECQDAVEWMDWAGPHPHGHGAKAARTTRMANCPSWRMSPPSWSPTTRKKMVTTVPAKRAARTTTLRRLTGTRVLLLTP